MTQICARIVLVGAVSGGAHEPALRQIPQEHRSSRCHTVVPVDDVERQLTERLVATSGSAPTTGATSLPNVPV